VGLTDSQAWSRLTRMANKILYDHQEVNIEILIDKDKIDEYIKETLKTKKNFFKERNMLKVIIEVEGDYTVTRGAGGDGHEEFKPKVDHRLEFSLAVNDLNGPTIMILEEKFFRISKAVDDIMHNRVQ